MKEINRLLEIMHQIRQNCPWDARQTHDSLKRYLLEETYETMELIDNEDIKNLKYELGDLLLQIVFHSELASEKGIFEFKDVVNVIADKMVERHPHVFKEKGKISASEVQSNWEKIKHKKENRKSILSGIPDHLPALLKAQRLQEKASSVGFDWSNKKDVIKKLDEEVNEFKEALENNENTHLQKELGDILFSIVNISRFIDQTAEEALQQTNKKFIRRFNYIEKHYNNSPEKLEQASLKELDTLWNESKKDE